MTVVRSRRTNLFSGKLNNDRWAKIADLKWEQNLITVRALWIDFVMCVTTIKSTSKENLDSVQRKNELSNSHCKFIWVVESNPNQKIPLLNFAHYKSWIVIFECFACRVHFCLFYSSSYVLLKLIVLLAWLFNFIQNDLSLKASLIFIYWEKADNDKLSDMVQLQLKFSFF